MLELEEGLGPTVPLDRETYDRCRAGIEDEGGFSIVAPLLAILDEHWQDDDLTGMHTLMGEALMSGASGD